MYESEDEEVCYERLSPSNVRSYSPKVSPISLSKHEPKKDVMNRHAKVDGEKPMRPQLYIK